MRDRVKVRSRVRAREKNPERVREPSVQHPLSFWKLKRPQGSPHCYGGLKGLSMCLAYSSPKYVTEE